MSDLAKLNQIYDEWQSIAIHNRKLQFARTKIKFNFSTKHALALIGVRRSGKTFYSLEIASEYLEENSFLTDEVFYINFEDPYFVQYHSTEILDKLVQIYVERNFKDPKIIILDEVQNIEHWYKWVRKYIDLNKFKIVVTGSSAKLLSQEFSTALTGRVVERKIYPLSFVEYLSIKNNQNELKDKNLLNAFLLEYLTGTAFPELIGLGDIERNIILRQYLNDIVYKDIASRYSIRSIQKLNLLINFYMTNISSLHSAFSIKKALEIDANTVSEYTKYLEDAFLIFTVKRYHKNLKIQKRDPQKIYSIDCGLRNISSSSTSPDLGKLFENIVFIELKRRDKEIYYFKNKGEVDFVVTENYKAK
jgi:predicted AAA+ superfamily ATPase